MKCPRCGYEEPGKRTNAQNRSIHKYFRLLSFDLAEQGATLDIERNGRRMELPWSETMLKEFWKGIQADMLGKTSTTKLDKSEVNQVYEVVSLNFAKWYGVSTPFPRWEDHFED